MQNARDRIGKVKKSNRVNFILFPDASSRIAPSRSTAYRASTNSLNQGKKSVRLNSQSRSSVSKSNTQNKNKQNRPESIPVKTPTPSKDISGSNEEFKEKVLVRTEVFFDDAKEIPVLEETIQNCEEEKKECKSIEKVEAEVVSDVVNSCETIEPVEESKAELDTWSDVAEHVKGDVCFFSDKNEIELGWMTYCSERELLSRWLVPSEENLVPGKYTLTFQSPYSKTTIIRETKPNLQYDSNEWISHYTKEDYIEELERLLGFMTAYDREKIVQRYRTMLFMTEDCHKMMEALGSPQELAATFANDYVASKEAKEEESKQEKSKEVKAFRSVAASYHADKEEKTDSDLVLTTFVDMEQLKEEDNRKNENNESDEVCDDEPIDKSEEGSNSKETASVKSDGEINQTPVEAKESGSLLAIKILVGLVKIALCTCIVGLLVTLSAMILFIIMNVWIDAFATLSMPSLLFLTGVSVSSLTLMLLLIMLGLNLFFSVGRKWKGTVQQARDVRKGRGTVF